MKLFWLLVATVTGAAAGLCISYLMSALFRMLGA